MRKNSLRKTTSQSDRRASPRIAVKNISCLITTQDELKSSIKGHMKDMSQNGLSAVFGQPLPPYCKIIATTKIADKDVSSEADIRWIREIEMNKYLYGIHFNSNEYITNYINENLNSGNIIDRRKKNRRKNQIELLHENRRGEDRRGTYKHKNKTYSPNITFLDKHIKAGYASYTDSFLSIYDNFVGKFSCKHIWNCPVDYFVDFYNKNISANHLEIGVGTGFLLDKCNFPSRNPRLALSDINSICLSFSVERLKRYKPEIYQFNVLEPIQLNIESFDTIGINGVLHCLPGTLRTKSIIFENLKVLLKPKGVIFGSTIINGGAEHNFIAKLILYLYNRKGVFTNRDDNIDELKYVLENNFKDGSVKIIGSMAFFLGKI